MSSVFLRVGTFVLLAAPLVPAQSCKDISLGQQASLNGFVPFPTNDPWRQNISGASVDPNSSGYIGFIGGSALFPNFGAGLFADGTIGVPYNVVSGAAKVNINYQAFGDISDPGPMPIPPSTWIEGYPAPGDGEDRHVLVLDRDNCFLYELFNSYLKGDGSWSADSGAVWDLENNNNRPQTWTSADAAGLPIFPGLVRYDEVAAGHIDHALRMTLRRSKAAFVAPATHFAANSSDPNAAVMGMRLRLKPDFDISSYTPQTKVILQALKTYGMIMADNGSNLYLTGTPDDRWDNDDLRNLRKVPASAFEVIGTGAATNTANLMAGVAPVVSSFTGTTTTGTTTTRPRRRSDAPVAAPTTTGATTLNWSTDASYVIISPEVGPVRGNSVTVNPTSTTTYTIYATNSFGRTTKTVTVNK